MKIQKQMLNALYAIKYLLINLIIHYKLIINYNVSPLYNKRNFKLIRT
jgi:hypothetical protein